MDGDMGRELIVVPHEQTALSTEVINLDDTIRRAEERLEKAQAASTKRAYSSDTAVYTDWMAKFNSTLEAMGECPKSIWPADPAVLTLFLSAQADQGYRPSTIERRLAAITTAHRELGINDAGNPAKHAMVRKMMSAVRRDLGAAPNRKAAATAEIVLQMISHCPRETLQGKRDRALLALGLLGAFRRSELVDLKVGDVSEVPGGIDVLMRRSKTDQEGQGITKAVPHGRMRVPEYVLDWIKAAGLQPEDPLFPRMWRGDRPSKKPMLGRAVAEVVKRYARKIGEDPEIFSGHSLRAGFATSAAETGAPLHKIMEQGGWRKADTVLGYIRAAERFRDHASKGFN